MNKTIRILMIGDIIGNPGRTMFQKHIGRLKTELRIDAIIVNGENSAHGKGITSRIVRFFRHNGADVITSGNHIWHNQEIYPYLSQHTDLLRPANFPPAAPGVGVTTFQRHGYVIGVVNLQGRIFMREHVDCPFRIADAIVATLRTKTPIIVVDFHAEASSEKMGLAYYLDGRVSAVVGTHTHVQTADERILPNGTAYITDLGMAGALDSMIGMQKEPILKHFLTQMPQKFIVETQGPMVLSGVYITVDTVSGHALAIERVRIIDDEIQIEGEG
jgi:2',3'-cyclic-nucleotide 2'-phosphodiesterase